MKLIEAMARRAFRTLPQGMALPILSGVNRGRRWIIGAGLIRCWLGTYESQELEAFIALVGPDDVVWDIGAHAGYFTLACAGIARQVVACEAAATNAQRLRRHLALNRIGNVTVIERAICDTDGRSIAFGDAGYQGAIGQGNRRVATASIDGLVAGGLPAPSVIKMDIEGAEAMALAGAADVLASARPTLMLALHGADLRRTCIAVLERASYDITDLNIGTILARYGA
jgi:FkbM family methyltransferase